MLIHLGKIAAIACAVAFAIATQDVIAAPNTRPTPEQQCRAGGYDWDAKKGCANKTCTSGGKTYQPGDTIDLPPRTKGGPTAGFMMCDGFSGAWQMP